MSRVTDVLSVGQVLNVMCIGLDVRGNINLSLKATLPKPKQKTTPDGESAVKVQNPVNNVPKEQENKAGQSPGDSSSSFVIRSATECDEEEKSSRPKPRSKTLVQRTPKVLKLVTNVQKEQENEADQSLGDGESISSIFIRSVTECDEEEKSSRPEHHSEGSS